MFCKRIAAVILGTILVVSPCYVSAGEINTEEFKADYTIGTAASGSFDAGGGSDVYHFTLEESGRVSIYMNELSGGWTQYNLYSENGSRIFYNNGFEASQTMEYDLKAGNYYFSISTDHAKTYAFTTSFTSAEETIPESMTKNNNTYKTADDIEIGETYYEQKAGWDDPDDYYRFVLDKPGKTMLKFKSGIPQGNCIDIYSINDLGQLSTSIFNKSGNTASDGYFTVNEDLYLQAGTYYFKYTHSGYDNGGITSTGRYTFSIEHTPSEETFAESIAKNNDTSDTADAIEFGTEYKGFMAKNEKADFFKITVTDTGTLAVNVSSISWVTVRLLNDSQNEIALKRAYKNPQNVVELSMDGMTPGTYYLEVIPEETANLGEYDFKVTFVSETKKTEPSEIPDNNGSKPSDSENQNQAQKDNEQAKKAANIQTKVLQENGYGATVSLNSSIPYVKKKSEVIGKITVTLSVTNSTGEKAGIEVKSIKATKPKNGVTKITIKLRGSTKDERKAAKVFNKSLKKIPVTVESNQS